MSGKWIEIFLMLVGLLLCSAVATTRGDLEESWTRESRAQHASRSTSVASGLGVDATDRGERASQVDSREEESGRNVASSTRLALESAP
jgi:hypothetical protein